MRIHMISNLFPPDVLGGYELLARDVASALQDRGHSVEVLTTGEDQGQPGVSRLLRLSRPFGSSPGRDRLRHLLAAAFNRVALQRHLARRGRPDAVLAMSLRRLGLEPLRVYRQAGVPVVLTVNDDWPVAYAAGPSPRLVDRGPWARHTFAGVEPGRVVYLSDAIRRHVLDAGAPLPRGRVQLQGVSTELFSSRPFRPVPAAPSLLFVGRLHPSKAPEVALDALASLLRRGVEARLVVAGAPVDRSYGESLLSRAETLGVAPRVTWLGQVERSSLPSVYRQADVFLFPSAFEGEGQGLTPMEAMACGVPVVAYPKGGAREVLVPSVCRLAARCDGEAFADEIIALQAEGEEGEPRVQRALALARSTSLGAYVEALERELLAASGFYPEVAHVPGRILPPTTAL